LTFNGQLNLLIAWQFNRLQLLLMLPRLLMVRPMAEPWEMRIRFKFWSFQKH
jgi:hypothetical protein